VTDPTLRLPNSTFRAVLDLGQLPLEAPPLPRRFAHPDLDADWDEDNKVAALYVEYEDGQLHVEATEDGVEYHFHRGDGDESGTVDSPWSGSDTDALVLWSAHLMAHLFPILPDLISDAQEAADWHAAGLTVYARDTGPVPLEIVEVEMEGELFILPWLGSGYVENEHVDGPHHPIVLLWNPRQDTPDIPIARAWLDPRSGEPRSKAENRVDWTEVGLPKAEVLSWLEGVYLNHHVLEDPAESVLRAALNRIAGVTSRD
jgi:hypothetical protein